MATITREQLRWLRNLSGGPAPVQVFPEATSQSVNTGSTLGEPCDLSSGRVRRAGGISSGGVSLASGSTILGIMADHFTNRSATSNVASARLGVVAASSETKFRGHVSSGASNQSLTAGMVGSTYGLFKLTSSLWTVDTAAASTYVRVTGLIDAVGDINGAVEFVLENDKIVYGD